MNFSERAWVSLSHNHNQWNHANCESANLPSGVSPNKSVDNKGSISLARRRDTTLGDVSRILEVFSVTSSGSVG